MKGGEQVPEKAEGCIRHGSKGVRRKRKKARRCKPRRSRGPGGAQKLLILGRWRSKSSRKPHSPGKKKFA